MAKKASKPAEQKEVKKQGTTIYEKARRALGITRDQYAFCAYVVYRSADSRQKFAGWCCDPKEEIADFVGISRVGLFKMAREMEAFGLVEISGTGAYRGTPKWIDTESGCKQSYQDGSKVDVNKVNIGRKQSLQKARLERKQSLQPIIKELDLKENKGEGENTPAPEASNGLEAKEEKKVSPGAAAEPTHTVKVTDAQTLPGTIITAIEGVNLEPEIPEPKISLRDRPNSETPAELKKAMSVFYHDRPLEWSDGVLKLSHGERYTTRKQVEIVTDWCCFVIKENRGGCTYGQLNADLQKWFRNQPTAEGWKNPSGQKENKEFYVRPPKIEPPMLYHE